MTKLTAWQMKEVFNIKLPNHLRPYLEREREKYYQETSIRISLTGLVAHILFNNQNLEEKGVKFSAKESAFMLKNGKTLEPRADLSESQILEPVYTQPQIDDDIIKNARPLKVFTAAARRVWEFYVHDTSSETIVETMMEHGIKMTPSNIRKHYQRTRDLLDVKTDDQAYAVLVARGYLKPRSVTDKSEATETTKT